MGTRILAQEKASLRLIGIELCNIWEHQRRISFPPPTKPAAVSLLQRSPPSRVYMTCGSRSVLLVLLLATWLGGCTADGTICSREPAVCDGTYSATFLCAPHEIEGPSNLFAGVRGWCRAGDPATLHGSRAIGRPPPLLPRRRPSRRYLWNSVPSQPGLSGSLPSQLGLFTTLTTL